MVEVVRETVRIPGVRTLVGELSYPIDSPSAACLLLNPHPYMGGRMDNNVVARLADALGAAGHAVLRFDYSGTGASEGPPFDVAAGMAEFWASGRAPLDPLMIEDGATALAWLERQTAAPLVVIGYSFGAVVAASIAPPHAAGIVLVSPTLRHHGFGEMPMRGVPALVIHGEDDFATDSETFGAWVARNPLLQVRSIGSGRHFFIGVEEEVAAACLDFIATLPIREVSLA